MDENRRKCALLMNLKRFDTMAVDADNLVVYNRFRFERDTPLAAWKRQWVVLSQWCVGILVDILFADLPFVRCEQQLRYSRRLHGAIHASM